MGQKHVRENAQTIAGVRWQTFNTSKAILGKTERFLSDSMQVWRYFPLSEGNSGLEMLRMAVNNVRKAMW